MPGLVKGTSQFASSDAIESRVMLYVHGDGLWFVTLIHRSGSSIAARDSPSTRSERSTSFEALGAGA